MRNYFLYLLLILLIPNCSYAQYDLAIGDWYSHLPYERFERITQSETTVYAATEWSVVAIDKEEFSIDFISKVDGLSNTGMGVIGYNALSDILVLTYTNSEFDLVKGSRIVSFGAISTDGNFTDRTINAITFDGADDLYIATAFGVIKFNLLKEEFTYTVDFGIPVFDVAVVGDQIYAAAEDGIYTVSKESSINQQDFNNWRVLSTTDGLPTSYNSQFIEMLDDKIFLTMNDSLFSWEDNELEFLHYEEGYTISFLKSGKSGMLVGFECIPNCQGKSLFLDLSTGQKFPTQNDCAYFPRDAIEDETGRIWYADVAFGIRIAANAGESCPQKINFNSPWTQFSSEILVYENEVYIASGGVKTNGSFIGRSDGVFYYDKDNNWNTFNRWTVPIFQQEGLIVDFYSLAVNPSNGNVFFGTFYAGMAEYNGEDFTIYNKTNSSLQGAVGDVARERIAGLAFDDENNLWISNSSAPEPISVMKNDGTWKSFAVPSFESLNRVVIDDLGYKWFIITGTGQGVLVFDDAGTIDNTSDDRYRIFSSSNSLLPDDVVLSIEVDRDGDVWVGTTNGVVVFECGQIVFNEDECVGSRRVVEENDFDEENEYLLKGEEVTAIAVDAANRKWFGTTNGLFVQSSNGNEQVAFFDDSNSPLFDNSIIDIAINHENGEVFIGTDKGVISYKSDALEGTPENSSNVQVYPNPVRPEYSGPIAIKGLAENANVKITDISGGLVYETKSLGGQAVWDGKDYNGRKASTGVYLVFSTSDNLTSPDAIVTKILIVN